MKNIFKPEALILLVGCFLSVQAIAEEEQDRFYAKLDLGSSTFSSYEPTGTATVTSASKVGDSWGITAGLQLSDFLSFELSHNDFGSSEGKIKIPTVGASSYKVEVSSNALSVIPSMPLSEKTRFFVELGQHVWEADVSQGASKGMSDGSDFFYGFGFSYDVREQIRTGFDFSKYKLDPDDFQNISVSLAYLF